MRHDIQKGDVILSWTGSDVSIAAFEYSVVGTIGSGGPGMAPGKLQQLHRIWTLRRSVEMSCLLCLRLVCTIDSGGPWYGTREAAETPQEMVADLECQTIV